MYKDVHLGTVYNTIVKELNVHNIKLVKTIMV